MTPLSLGNNRIERVAEIDTMYFDPKWMYYNIEDEMLHRHKDSLGPLSIHPETLQLGLSFHSYVVRSKGLNILVDTCNGNHKNRLPKHPWYNNLQASTYLENLARVGLRPEEVSIQQINPRQRQAAEESVTGVFTQHSKTMLYPVQRPARGPLQE